MKRRRRRGEKVVVVAPRKAILLFGCDLSAEAGQRRKMSMIERNKKWTDFWGLRMV